MRRLLLNLLLRLFFKDQREIKKLSLGEELTKYRFKSPEDTLEILKHNRTCMTLWHFETANQKEADIVKGMALMLNIIIDANKKAVLINKAKVDDDKKEDAWRKYKNIEKSNIWNNLLKAVRGSGAK
jgi:hypothetical protein